jgi:hypothetical protein
MDPSLQAPDLDHKKKTDFSISRGLRSSKLFRRPQRGQLGNGLRVVAGAVLVSSGSLTIITRNRRIALRPELDGSTSVIKVTEADRPRHSHGGRERPRSACSTHRSIEAAGASG